MPRAKKVSAEQIPETTDVPVQEVKPSAPKRKAEAGEEKTICLQYGGGEWNVADLEEKVIAAYVSEGHRRGRIKKLVIYLKPEEHKVYYVINGKTTGSIDFD